MSELIQRDSNLLEKGWGESGSSCKIPVLSRRCKKWLKMPKVGRSNEEEIGSITGEVEVMKKEMARMQQQIEENAEINQVQMGQVHEKIQENSTKLDQMMEMLKSMMDKNRRWRSGK